MQIRVLVSKLLPSKEGTTKTGNPYLIQDFIGRTFDQYPKEICFSIFNPDANKPIPQEGNDINVEFDIESRSYVGKDGVERWNTSLRVQSIVSAAQPQAQPQYAQPSQPQQYPQRQPQYAQPATAPSASPMGYQQPSQYQQSGTAGIPQQAPQPTDVLPF